MHKSTHARIAYWLCDSKQILHFYCVGYHGSLITEYYHSEGSNKPDIQHSKSAIFVLLYSLYACTQNRLRALRSETMHSLKTAVS